MLNNSEAGRTAAMDRVGQLQGRMGMHIVLNASAKARWLGATLGICLLQAGPALAYKVEKVCEEVPATATSKANTKCKIVVVRPAKEGEEPKEKKEEAAGGHGAKPEAEAKPKH